MLNTAEITRYATDGYLPGRPLLTAEETAYYRAGCERVLRPAREGRPPQAIHQPGETLPAVPLGRRAGAPHAHPRLRAESLIGPDIMVFHTTVWLKEPHSETFVPWHQDATYFGLAPFEHVTAWVALTDSTPENGCVQIIPHSHTTGQRPHFDQPDPKAMLSRGQTLADTIDETRAVALVLRRRRGIVPPHAGFHRSGINRTDDTAHRHRRQLHPDPRAPCRRHAAVGHAGPRDRHATGTSTTSRRRWLTRTPPRYMPMRTRSADSGKRRRASRPWR